MSDQRIIDKLVTGRIALLLKHPFFGNLATRLKLVNADDWCPTAGTDGRHFFYNTKFIDSLTPKEAEFLFGHEVLHNVYEHLGRSKLNKHRNTPGWSVYVRNYETSSLELSRKLV